GEDVVRGGRGIELQSGALVVLLEEVGRAGGDRVREIVGGRVPGIGHGVVAIGRGGRSRERRPFLRGAANGRHRHHGRGDGHRSEIGRASGRGGAVLVGGGRCVR